MTTRLEDLGITKVALCGQGMNPEAEVLLFKAKAPETSNPKEVSQVADITKADLEAKVAELEAELGALAELSNEDLAALKGFEIAKAEPTEDEVLKSLPDEVRERIEKAEADARTNADRIAKMESERRVESFVRKARDEYGDLAPAEEFGQALEQIEAAAPAEAFKALEGVLKSAAAKIDATVLFKEAGGAGTSDTSKLDEKVAEILTANPDLPRERAVAKALAEDASLADEWQSATK